jgi:ABC-type uncharacterized transport system auxiliary subunit
MRSLFLRLSTLLMMTAALLSVPGCSSLGGSAPSIVWYLLHDMPSRASKPASATGSASTRQTVLMIGSVGASAFDESQMIAYGRSRGTRAHYQLAGWTERPSRRLGILVEHRLQARGEFAAVVQSTAGVRGQLLLNLRLEQLYHDVSTEPGHARAAIVAELVDWTDHRLLGRRVFSAESPAQSEDAQAAVDAFGRAVGTLLDDLSVWVEATAAAAR